MSKINLDELAKFLKENGFIFQGSEIYGGLANSYDFGPLGALLKQNVKNSWWKKFITENPYNVGLDSAILMNPKVWEASGHLKSFSDPLIDCKHCKTRYRADKLIEDFTNGKETGDNWSNEKLMEFIDTNHINCPNCGEHNFTSIRQFNLMYKTFQGVTEDTKNTIYMRPETAQGIFVNFKNVQRSMRKKLPFGIGQIGKSFRNEITPGNFIFRVREFEQMELEYFVKPGTELEWFDYYRKYCNDFLQSMGIKAEDLRYRDHEKEELAFYSNATTDIEYNFPWGFAELWGIASRTDYDLKKHMEYSKENLEYQDPEDNSKYIPYVVEPSVGVGRLFLAFLLNGYENETLPDGSTREVLHSHPALSPYKAVVLPLMKKLHSDKATEIFNDLSKEFTVSYDETQAIGKRYRRADAIGTPFAITIDDDTLNNNTVTVRDRDTMTQEIVKVEDLRDYIRRKIEF